MPQTNYYARVEAPISSDVQAMLQHPTGLQGRSMTVFVVTAVQAAAQQAIEQAEPKRMPRGSDSDKPITT
jgi:uncharacterized protein (DUF1778 family)